MNRMRKSKNGKHWLLSTALSFSLLISAYVSAQPVSIVYPAETLVARLDRIRDISPVVIAYDVNIIGEAEVPDLSLNQVNWEEVLENSLASTGFFYKKLADGSYVIVKKEAIKQTPVSVKGRVVDIHGVPVIGANVMVKGSTQGVVTDIDGNFVIEVPADATLQFSYIGYTTREVTVGKKTTLDIVLEEDTYAINEVVVTALGISREKKALGYSVQDLNGDELTNLNSNFSSALAGKVAGVAINSNSVAGGTTRVIIRGESSLNYQANQPLYVIFR